MLLKEVRIVAKLKPELSSDLNQPVRVAHALEEIGAVEISVRNEALAEGTDRGHIAKVNVERLLEVEGLIHGVLCNIVLEELEETPGYSGAARRLGDIENGVGWHNEAKRGNTRVHQNRKGERGIAS